MELQRQVSGGEDQLDCFASHDVGLEEARAELGKEELQVVELWHRILEIGPETPAVDVASAAAELCFEVREVSGILTWSLVRLRDV